MEVHTPIKNFFKVSEVANIWHVDTETIYRMIRNDQLSHMKIGKAIRVPVESIIMYQEENLTQCQDQSTKPQTSESDGSKIRDMSQDTAQIYTLNGQKGASRNMRQLARKMKPRPKAIRRV